MKKIAIISLLLALALNFGIRDANAQSLKRLQFGKGKTSATVKGSTGSYGVMYVVRARAGQKLVLSLSPSNGVGIKVDRGGRYEQEVFLREERGGTFVVSLEESGDYTIYIGSTENRPTPFTLTVKITQMTDI
jgi:hypothetical protein